MGQPTHSAVAQLGVSLLKWVAVTVMTRDIGAWQPQAGNLDRAADWGMLAQETDPRPCLISDETGSCVVLPYLADRCEGMVRAVHTEDGSFWEAPDPVRNLGAGAFGAPIEFCEERFDAGAGYVVGRFVTPQQAISDDSQARMRAGVDAVLRSWRDDAILSVLTTSLTVSILSIAELNRAGTGASSGR